MNIDETKDTKLSLVNDPYKGRVSITGLKTESGLVNSAQGTTKDNTFNERY
jgi:hypothetical protein